MSENAGGHEFRGDAYADLARRFGVPYESVIELAREDRLGELFELRHRGTTGISGRTAQNHLERLDWLARHRNGPSTDDDVFSLPGVAARAWLERHAAVGSTRLPLADQHRARREWLRRHVGVMSTLRTEAGNR